MNGCENAHGAPVGLRLRREQRPTVAPWAFGGGLMMLCLPAPQDFRFGRDANRLGLVFVIGADRQELAASGKHREADVAPSLVGVVGGLDAFFKDLWLNAAGGIVDRVVESDEVDHPQVSAGYSVHG